MDPIRVPTDSLYKFMAISGVAMALVSIYLIVSMSEQRLRNWTDHTVRYQQFLIDLAATDDRVTPLGGEAARLRADIEGATVQDSTARRRFAAIEPRFEDLQDQVRGLLKTHEAVERNREFLAALDRQRGIVMFALSVAAAIGAALAAIGFYLWYHRVQKYLDIELLARSVDTLKPVPSNGDPSN